MSKIDSEKQITTMNPNSSVSPVEQLEAMCIVQMLTPHQLFDELQFMANQIEQAQDKTLEQMKKVVQPLEEKVSLPKFGDYEQWQVRADRIRDRNFELMKKVLNLRAKVLKFYYFSARKSQQGSQEQYNLALKDLLDHKDNARHMRAQLLQSYIISESQRNVSGLTQNNSQSRKYLNLEPKDQKTISNALELLSKECTRSRLQLEYIEYYIHQRNREK